MQNPGSTTFWRHTYDLNLTGCRSLGLASRFAWPGRLPPPPLPEVRTAEPVHEQVSSAPRAQLLHIRAIGTYENDRIPDGPVLNTLYKGELPSARNLPTTAGQMGDMWYTKNDGHCWVLSPITTGSQTTGWVDP
jgi:hypothetical protein